MRYALSRIPLSRRTKISILSLSPKPHRTTSTEIHALKHYAETIRSVLRLIPGVDRHHTTREIFVRDVFKPDVLHHLLELFLTRKLSNALHQVLIRPSIARDDLTELGNDVEAIKVVYASQHVVFHVTKLENHVLSARLQTPIRIRHRRLGVVVAR